MISYNTFYTYVKRRKKYTHLNILSKATCNIPVQKDHLTSAQKNIITHLQAVIIFLTMTHFFFTRFDNEPINASNLYDHEPFLFYANMDEKN